VPFEIKSLLGSLLQPLSVVVLLLALAVVLLWLAPWRRAGRVPATLALLLLLATSLHPVADRLLLPLEREVPALLGVEGLEDVGFVAVLGAGHASDPLLPITSQLSDTAVVRVVEGVRLHRQLPASRLVLTGWGGRDREAAAEMMARLAESLGVERARMALDGGPRDTAEEMRAIAALVGDRRVVVVTEASHMPRALELAAAQGIEAIPAPTRHRVAPSRRRDLYGLLPAAEAARNAERAVHEWLGRLWARIAGLV
jgi:uncharacterized SAM-binding protein YcdF (DUF218 family)